MTSRRRASTSATISGNRSPRWCWTGGNGNFYQFVNAQLMKNVANRRHAINFNSGYDLPTASQHFGNDFGKSFAKVVLDGWHLNGNGAIYAGTPYSVGCGATGQPSQFR